MYGYVFIFVKKKSFYETKCIRNISIKCLSDYRKKTKFHQLFTVLICRLFQNDSLKKNDTLQN